MEIFSLTFSQMLMMFFLMATGYMLRKKSILPLDSGTVMSKLEMYVFTPALTLSNQISKCTIETFAQNYTLIIYGLVICVIAIIIAHPLSRAFITKSSKLADADYQRNIYKYAMTFGNYGFMGNFIVLGVWGDDMFYKYSLFTFGVGLLCSSWGLYILIPKDKNASIWANLKKGLLAPPMVALGVGMAIGLLGLKQYIPDFMMSAFENAGKCQGPVAMVLAGFVIGGYSFKELIKNKKVYIATLLRLIVIPAAMMLALRVLGIAKEIMLIALITFATPLGMNTIVYPAAYGGDTKTGASMTMISHTLCVITIPIMYLLFIEIL